MTDYRVNAPLSLRFRETPNGTFIRYLPDGEVLTGLPAPLNDAGGFTWRCLRDAQGVIGWAADRYLQPVVAPLNGIDVSENQPTVDWQQVKAAGCGFAIIRATQGVATSDPVGVDRRFRQHIDGALAAGLKVGVYHAFIASREGNAQAQFFMETVRPFRDRLSYPLAIDVELDNGQTPAVITGRLFDMASTLTALGAGLPMIYTSPGFWNAHTVARNDDYFGTLPLWVAHWTNAAQPMLPRAWQGKSWAFWQWRVDDDGIPGYAGRIDLDRAAP